MRLFVKSYKYLFGKIIADKERFFFVKRLWPTVNTLFPQKKKKNLKSK